MDEFHVVSALWAHQRGQKGFGRREEKVLGDTTHLISAAVCRLQQEGKEFILPPEAKVFNLLKPSGLSRCLIIKGVWTKGYSKPAGASNWTFSTVFDGWLTSETVRFLCCVSVELLRKTPKDPSFLFSSLKLDNQLFDAATSSKYEEGQHHPQIK